MVKSAAEVWRIVEHEMWAREHDPEPVRAISEATR